MGLKDEHMLLIPERQLATIIDKLQELALSAVNAPQEHTQAIGHEIASNTTALLKLAGWNKEALTLFLPEASDDPQTAFTEATLIKPPRNHNRPGRRQLLMAHHAVHANDDAVVWTLTKIGEHHLANALITLSRELENTGFTLTSKLAIKQDKDGNPQVSVAVAIAPEDNEIQLKLFQSEAQKRLRDNFDRTPAIFHPETEDTTAISLSEALAPAGVDEVTIRRGRHPDIRTTD
jgi:hypothetical protein